MIPAPPGQALRAHVAHLEGIDTTYWWHRVRWRVVRQAIRRHGRGRPLRRYYDVGSGGGGLACLLQPEFQFGEVRLFDQYPTTVRQPGMEHRVIDLEDNRWDGLPAPDLVTCLDVLEHLRDPSRMLQAMAGAWPGSRPLLIVTVPALRQLWSAWDEQLGHYRRYTRGELAQLIASSGWRLRACRYLFHAAVPIAFLSRRLGRRRDGVAFPRVSRPVNRGLEAWFWAEARITGRLPVPFGTSLVAVAD